MEKVEFSEIEIAEDVKSFINCNPKSCSEDLKSVVLFSKDDEFLKVTKQIASPLKIINIEKVTDEMLENSL